MVDHKKFIVSHAPFWHSGSNIPERSYHTMIAAIPAVAAGLYYFGMPALGVISFSIAFAVLWELVYNIVAKRPNTVGDGNAAVIGLIFGMMLPASAPWWLVVIGTLIAIVIGKQIYGGIGASPFHPVLVAMAMLILSWKDVLNFDSALLNYPFDFVALYPLGAVKHFGASAAASFTVTDLILGKQIGGIGSTFGLGLIVGGLYLIYRGFIRWEISLSFIAGLFITAMIFNMANPERFAGPMFHLFTGYTLICAFFLATEDASSPINFMPMIIYGAGGGILTMLIRNIGAYADGVVFAILFMNILNPLLDKIRPKAIGKVV